MSETLERRQRSTQFEMNCREKHVIERLEDGPKSINELFGDTEWSYAQAIITIRKMKQDKKIFQLRKNGREVIYSLCGEHSYPDYSKVTDHMGDNAKIVAFHLLETEGCRIDLQFPNGDKLEAMLLAS